MLPFVKRDLEILKSANDVRVIDFKMTPSKIWELWRGVAWCDLTYSWFGKLHAFFAVLFSKILGKKSIVVAGGDDVARVPEINYGMLLFWWKKWCPLFVFRFADRIISVSEYNAMEAVANANVDNSKLTIIHHGFDADRFKVMKDIEKEQLVITVGGIDKERLGRKGYELFIKSAAYLPDVRFALIGKWHDDSIDYLRVMAAKNVFFAGEVTDAGLLEWFSRAKVYVQLSRHEAFGCSLAEAMLCKNVPVVSKTAAIPEVVGPEGIYIDELNPGDIAQKIKMALSLPAEIGAAARDRIINKFPLSKRKEMLLGLIREIGNG